MSQATTDVESQANSPVCARGNSSSPEQSHSDALEVSLAGIANELTNGHDATDLRLARLNGHLQRIGDLLERAVDALEIKAIIEAQVCVPERVGEKLTPWRDHVLARMAKRYEERIKDGE